MHLDQRLPYKCTLTGTQARGLYRKNLLRILNGLECIFNWYFNADVVVSTNALLVKYCKENATS